MRKLILFLFLLPTVSAQLEISEIMYDLDGTDAGREWIEIYNSGDKINISGWKFYEAETNHRLSSYSGDMIIENDEFFIIVNNSWQSLSNTGELIQILDGKNGNIISEVEYVADEEGLTLQIIAGEWCSGSPTPGEANECSIIEIEETDEETSAEVTTEVSEEIESEPKTEEEIKQEIIEFIEESEKRPTENNLVKMVYEANNRGNIVIGFYLFILVSLMLNVILVLRSE